MRGVFIVLRTLIIKRIRLNILSLRFVYGAALVFGLTILSGVVTTQSFHRRVEYGQARELEWRGKLNTASTYNQTYGQVILWPPSLSLISNGVGDRFGMIAHVFGQFGGVSIGGQAESNYLLALLPIDLTHVIGLLLSLIAILLTYDAISGDRESGTLRLVLSNNVARYTVFVSEYLAALATLILAVLPAALVWLLVVRNAGLPSFTVDEWRRLVLFFVATVLFISTYVIIGLVLSSTLRESTTSLMCGLLIWVFTVSLHPSLAAWSAIQIQPIALSNNVSDRTLLNQMAAQAQLARNLQLLSPVQIFHAIAGRLAGTDLESYLRFVKYADQYQEQVAEWHRQKLAQHPERESQLSSESGLLDIEGFPHPAPVTNSPVQQVISSLPYFFLLIGFNAGLMIAGLLAVNRYDPR